MPAAINEILTVSNEIVISERVVTTEWKVVEINEHITERCVRANIEFGPFLQDNRPSGTVLRGTGGSRSMTVWEGEEYDAIRDIWTNADLLNRIQTILEG